jgi:DNA polymerase-1
MATKLFEVGAPDALYVVDLSSYLLRAYHAVAPLSAPSGEPTHAVHGTVTMLERLFRERQPHLLCVAQIGRGHRVRTIAATQGKPCQWRCRSEPAPLPSHAEG